MPWGADQGRGPNPPAPSSYPADLGRQLLLGLLAFGVWCQRSVRSSRSESAMGTTSAYERETSMNAFDSAGTSLTLAAASSSGSQIIGDQGLSQRSIQDSRPNGPTLVG